MTDELESVVDDLALIRNHRNVQECAPGPCQLNPGEKHKRPHEHTTYTSTPPLLHSLQDAITASIGGTTSGRSLAFERSVLDTESLEQAMKISAAIESWCFMVDAKFTRTDLSASLTAWSRAWLATHPDEAATAWYVTEIRGWAGFIIAKVNRAEHTSLELPCPVCDTTRYMKDDGDEDSWPIKITWRKGELKYTAKAKCAACDTEWPSWEAIEELRREYAEKGQLNPDAHAADLAIRDALANMDACVEEVARKGEVQPCEKPAVALRMDPTHGVPYPVCAFHARSGMVPLTTVVRAVQGLAETGTTSV